MTEARWGWAAAGATALLVASWALLYLDLEVEAAWLPLAMARATLERNTLALPGLQPTHLIDSPAWFGVAWLAELAVRSGSAAAPLPWLRLASGLCAWLALLGAAWFGRTRIDAGPLRWLPLLLLALDPWFARAATDGTGDSLAVAVVVWGLLGATSASADRRLLALGLVAWSGPLPHPELLLLGGLLALRALGPEGALRAGGFGARLAATALALPTLAWLGFSWANFGTVIPATWGGDGMAATLGGLAYHGLTAQAAALLALGVAAALGAGRRMLIVDAAPRLVGVWLTGCLLLRVILGEAEASWLPHAAAIALVAPVALDRAAAGRPLRLDRSLGGLAAVAAVSFVLVTASRSLPTASGERVEALRVAGSWLDGHGYSRDRVAVRELGVLGYHSRVGLLPVGSPWVSESAAETVARHRARFSLVGGAAGAEAQEVLRRAVAPSDPRRRPAPSQVVLLELDWPSR